MEPNGPAKERVCPRACATARPGKERAPHAGQAGHTRSTARQHAQRHKTRHHQGKHPRPMTNEPPTTSPSPAVPTAQQPPSGWTCVRPAGYPTPAGYDRCRPDGRVCARQWTQPLPATNQPPSGWTCLRPAVNPAPVGYKRAAVRMDVCAPGSEPSPCQLQNSRRPDGRVCARQ